LLGLLVADLGCLGNARAALVFFAGRDLDLDYSENVVRDVLRGARKSVGHRETGGTDQEPDDSSGGHRQHPEATARSVDGHSFEPASMQLPCGGFDRPAPEVS